MDSASFGRLSYERSAAEGSDNDKWTKVYANMIG